MRKSYEPPNSGHEGRVWSKLEARGSKLRKSGQEVSRLQLPAKGDEK
jgi:hypothetical protein